MRAPDGFARWPVKCRVGEVFVRRRGTRWTVLAYPPDVQIDNAHRDARPHAHPRGWGSPRRVELRHDLIVEDAAAAVQRHLEARDFIDVQALVEELS